MDADEGEDGGVDTVGGGVDGGMEGVGGGVTETTLSSTTGKETSASTIRAITRWVV